MGRIEYHFRGNRSFSPDEKILTNFHESVPHPHLRSLILIQIHWTFDDDSDVSQSLYQQLAQSYIKLIGIRNDGNPPYAVFLFESGLKIMIIKKSQFSVERSIADICHHRFHHFFFKSEKYWVWRDHIAFLAIKFRI